MTQHERLACVRVVPKYNLDTLGAPFGVMLYDSVTVETDFKTGKETVSIPDLVGLIGAVVRARVSHERKLNGAEIKFVRGALGAKAKSCARFLDMTPEHFSRCEAGTKVMSANHEKLFRLFAFGATFYSSPEEELLGNGISEEEAEQQAKRMADPKYKKLSEEFIGRFFDMKINPAYDPAKELVFEFARRSSAEGGAPAGANDDCEWSKAPVRKRA